jgi:hypothetical protein
VAVGCRVGEVDRTRRAFHRRFRDRFHRVVTQEFENATRAVRLSIKQNCAARSQCSHAEVVCSFALRPIKSIEKRGNI